ncbi:hypothetical protein ACFE04_026515 [Oxalis oulophora]
MGCWYSKLEREETVSRCKARKRYMKQLVKSRQSLSATHTMFLRSLRSTGSALLQFSTHETTLHHHHAPPHAPPPQLLRPPLTPPRPPPPPPMSSSTDTWSTSTGGVLPPPPPPPPPPPSSSWDFWDPFVASSSRAGTEEEWDTTTASEMVVTTAGSGTTVAASITAPPSMVSGFSKESGSTELAIVTRNGKDLLEIVKEVDEYFLRAADAGGLLSILLEVSSVTNFTKGGKVYNYGCNLSPSIWHRSSSHKMNDFGKMGDGMINLGGSSGGTTTGGGGESLYGSHCSTVERLYAWEKKLFQEVKDAESIRIEHERRTAQLRKLEVKRSDYVKTEKTKKEVEKLESQMVVSTQAIETTSTEIVKLRETELYPQLIELVKGMMCMWRSMYECHQVQTHIVQQLKYLNTFPSTEPTSEIHRQSTLQLELEVQQWHQSFCNLVKAQRDYIQSLTGWLRLSLFQFSKNPLLRSSQESRIYSLCEEWHLAFDRIPDKVASEGIKSFLTVIHGIVVQQNEELKQKKRSDSCFKEFEKKAAELRSLESKFGPFAAPEGSKDPVAEKRAKVEILRRKAEEEKSKHEKSVSVTRAMTVNNLQMGFPHVFQAMVGFSSVCMQAFESVYNQAKNNGEDHEVKRLLPRE